MDISLNFDDLSGQFDGTEEPGARNSLPMDGSGDQEMIVAALESPENDRDGGLLAQAAEIAKYLEHESDPDADVIEVDLLTNWIESELFTSLCHRYEELGLAFLFISSTIDPAAENLLHDLPNICHINFKTFGQELSRLATDEHIDAICYLIRRRLRDCREIQIWKPSDWLGHKLLDHCPNPVRFARELAKTCPDLCVYKIKTFSDNYLQFMYELGLCHNRKSPIRELVVPGAFAIQHLNFFYNVHYYFPLLSHLHVDSSSHVDFDQLHNVIKRLDFLEKLKFINLNRQGAESIELLKQALPMARLTKVQTLVIEYSRDNLIELLDNGELLKIFPYLTKETMEKVRFKFTDGLECGEISHLIQDRLKMIEEAATLEHQQLCKIRIILPLLQQLLSNQGNTKAEEIVIEA